MGLLDMLFGGDGQPQQNNLPMEELRQLGLSDGLINYYQQEQAKAQKAAMWNNLFNGAANIASGAQGMGARFGGSGDGGGGSSGPGANTPLSLDGLVDRALKFSQVRSAMLGQQNIAAIRQAIAADPNLSPQEKQAYGTNPEAYLKLIEKSVERRTAPDDIKIEYDSDKRPVAAFSTKNQRMLSQDELEKANITLAGGLAPSKMMEMEDNLRKEYTGSGETKRYIEADPIYRSMVKSATNDTGAADLDLVYGIGKIMDPGSVVREGEMVMVNRSSPFAEMLQGYIGSIQGQGKLTPETRARLIEMARTRMGELRAAHDEIAGGVKSRAEERKIDPSRVLSRKYDELPEAPLWSGKENMWLPMEAIQSLRSNPSPERQQTFDEKFGAGMSARILRGR